MLVLLKSCKRGWGGFEITCLVGIVKRKKGESKKNETEPMEKGVRTTRCNCSGSIFVCCTCRCSLASVSDVTGMLESKVKWKASGRERLSPRSDDLTEVNEPHHNTLELQEFRHLVSTYIEQCLEAAHRANETFPEALSPKINGAKE